MKTEDLSDSSRILIISTGYNCTGFLAGLNSILNQLIYARELGFIPVVYFNPWSNDFPDFNRQQLFQCNLWQDYFQPINFYSYEEILAFIASPNHPLTKRNLHYLSNEEILYLGFGNPESVFSGFYGYYKHYQGDRQEWRITQRKKAAALINQHIQIKADHIKEIEIDFQKSSEKAPLLGVVIHCFERSDTNSEFRPSLQPYFESIDEYVKNNPKCQILLACGDNKFIRKFQKRYGNRLKLPSIEHTEKDRGFYQWLVLSKCDFLLKDHSELGEFILYLNPNLPFKDVCDEFKPLSVMGRYSRQIHQEVILFKKRWKTTINDEGSSLKILARLIILANPITQVIMKSLEKHRYSKFVILRWSVLFIDYVKLIRATTYFPNIVIKHRAFHAANNIGAGFYNFEQAPQKKYFEIRNAWDTNTGFFAYFMFALQQLRFAEIHGLKPVVNFNEPHNHFFEVGYSINTWENYFEPVTDLDSNSLGQLNGEEVTFIDHKYHDRPGNETDPPEMDELNTKIWFENNRARRAALTKKYIKPKAFILEIVNDFYEEFMIDSDVLGVHIRGTDKEVDQKGKKYQDQEELVRKIRPDEYFLYIDEYLSAHSEAKIFVATDQQQYLDSFIEHYGERIISNTVMRSTSSEPLFRLDKGSKFQRGLEVMCDALILSRCDYLIKSWSNVGEAAICFNPSIPVVDVMYLPEIGNIDFTHKLPAVPEDSLRLHEYIIGA